MREKKTKSVIPVYGLAAAWVLFCALSPLYRTWHFIALACSSALVYIVLSALFPGKTVKIEIPEEPERTGDEPVDSLLAEGERAIEEMRALREAIRDEPVKEKLTGIIYVVDAIFKRLLEYPGDYKQIKRFSEFYMPTTIKLLHTYDRFGHAASGGENIEGTRGKIEAALDMILDSYGKFFDSLFQSQALDVETDIVVLENMLRNEGLLN